MGANRSGGRLERLVLTCLVAWSAVVISMATPNITLKVLALGGTAAIVALYSMIGSITGMVPLLLFRLFKPLNSTALTFVAIGWIVVGNACVAMSSSVLNMTVAGVTSAVATSIPVSQYFARLGQLNSSSIAGSAVSRPRAMYALGWIVGVSLGGWLGGVFGPSVSFGLMSAAYAASGIALAIFIRSGLVIFPPSRRERWPDVKSVGVPGNGAQARWRIVNTFILVLAVISAGGQMRGSVLPAFIIRDLGADPRLLGAVFAVTPCVEIPMLIAMPVIVRKLGTTRVLMIGCVCAGLFFVGLAVSTSVLTVAILQGLFGVYAACATGLAMGLIQDYMKSDMAAATARALAGEKFGNLLGGAVAVTAAATLPLRFGFLVPGLLCLVGAVVISFPARTMTAVPAVGSSVSR